MIFELILTSGSGILCVKCILIIPTTVILGPTTDGVLEIIESYLYALNKTQFLKEANVPRSTAYNFFKRRNPTIKTLAKIIHASALS
jgi:hypothetical protein